MISKEESNFFSTIDGGLERIDRVFREMAKTGRVMVSGDEAADMYTTHGFPPELFETLAAERNFTFDWSGYRAAMERHGVESGGGQKVELFQSSPLDALKKAMHGSEFLGYEAVESHGPRRGIDRAGQAVRSYQRGRSCPARGGGPRQDPFLWRKRRPGRRHRHPGGGRRAL